MNIKIIFLLIQLYACDSISNNRYINNLRLAKTAIRKSGSANLYQIDITEKILSYYGNRNSQTTETIASAKKALKNLKASQAKPKNHLRSMRMNMFRRRFN